MKKDNCFECSGTGIVYVPDGMDDMTPEYCFCLKGKNLELQHDIRALAKSKTYA